MRLIIGYGLLRALAGLMRGTPEGAQLDRFMARELRMQPLGDIDERKEQERRQKAQWQRCPCGVSTPWDGLSIKQVEYSSSLGAVFSRTMYCRGCGLPWERREMVPLDAVKKGFNQNRLFEGQ